MNKFIFILLFFCSIRLFSQTETTITKDRFEFLTDSLSTIKAQLLVEKKRLTIEIDSLKNVLSDLNEKWKSSRSSQLVRKYGNKIAKRISGGQVWKGMTEKMLEDSWG